MMQEPIGYVRSAEKLLELLLHIGKVWTEETVALLLRRGGLRNFLRFVFGGKT